MRQTDFETLSAYVDGELSEAEERAVEERLAGDAAARAMVDGFCRNDAVVRAALAGQMGADLPPRLADAVVRAFDSRAAAGRRRGIRRIAPWAAAIAAALIIGVGIGYQIAEQASAARFDRLAAARLDDQRLIDEAVARALEKHVSGQPVDWTNPANGSRGSVTPILTYRSAGGQWCRRFARVTHYADRTETVEAIACREPNGRWRERLQLYDKTVS